MKKFQLGLQPHRLDERLIAVAQIHAAPHGRALHHALFRPIHAPFGGQNKLSAILFHVHIVTSLFFAASPNEKSVSFFRKRRLSSRGTTLFAGKSRPSAGTIMPFPRNGGIPFLLTPRSGGPLCGEFAPPPLPSRTSRRLSESRHEKVTVPLHSVILLP